MKYVKLFFLTIFLFSKGLSAQEAEPVLLNVVYKTIHVNDTNHRDQPLVEDMLLMLGQTSSKYIRAANKPRPEPVNTGGGPTVVAVGRPMAVVNGPGITEIELYQYPAAKKLDVTASLGMQRYLMEGKLPQIDWKIKEETRQIDAYACQKATGYYAGRVYTAWFTSELPFQCGPWKFSGLPGLILEVEDEKKKYGFCLRKSIKTAWVQIWDTAAKNQLK